MPAEAFGEVERFGPAQPNRDAQEGLGRSRIEHAGHRVRIDVEPILIEPARCRFGRDHVERDGEALGRQLAVDVAMCAVVDQAARSQRAAFRKAQVRRLAAPARHLRIVVLEIVAQIAGAEVAHRQEIEIVIVRQAVDEAARAAGAEGVIALGWPDVGAQEIAVAAARKHDRLRAVAAFDAVVAIRVRDLRDE